MQKIRCTKRMERKNMKDIFLNLILDFVKVYPQYSNERINYAFSGSISYNLLSCISGEIINMYSFSEFKLKKINSLKVDGVFKKYFRPISDIDVEVYHKEIFKNINCKNKIYDSNFKFDKYYSCFNQNIDKVYLDFFNSKSDFIFEIKINNISVWIDDFRLNYGYRLKTLINLPEERFRMGHPKYEYTVKKYSYDINYLCKIYLKCFGKQNTSKFIEGSLNSLCKDDASSPNKLQINKLLKRIEKLNISKYTKSFLFNTLENFKIENYDNLFFQDSIFLLNNFREVESIDLINLGKSKNIKYKIKMNGEYYLLKTNKFMTEEGIKKTAKVVKRINRYLPENSQHIEFFGYHKEFKESYVVYKYIEGKSLNEVDAKDLFSLGIITGKLLSKLHEIPTIGLSLKNESKFLNKIQKNANLDTSEETNKQKIINYIKQNKFNLGKKNVLLHNDLNLGNIILSNNKIVIIDFDNCVKGDWFIDFKKKLRNKNKFFEGLFQGYAKEDSLYIKKVNLVLFLYEYYYMNNIPTEMNKKKIDILKRHDEFLDYFSDIL